MKDTCPVNIKRRLQVFLKSVTLYLQPTNRATNQQTTNTHCELLYEMTINFLVSASQAQSGFYFSLNNYRTKIFKKMSLC